MTSMARLWKEGISSAAMVNIVVFGLVQGMCQIWNPFPHPFGKEHFSSFPLLNSSLNSVPEIFSPCQNRPSRAGAQKLNSEEDLLT